MPTRAARGVPATDLGDEAQYEPGNGGLQWSQVWPLIERHIRPLPINVEVWVPEGEETDAEDEPQLDLFSD